MPRRRVRTLARCSSRRSGWPPLALPLRSTAVADCRSTFLQASAPLALAAGIAAAWCWPRDPSAVAHAGRGSPGDRRPSHRQFRKVADATAYDLAHMRGEIEPPRVPVAIRPREFRRQVLRPKQSRIWRPISAIAPARTTASRFSASRRGRWWAPDASAPRDSSGAGRSSSDSRTIETGYGVAGLIGELDRYHPPLIVLQERDWDPDGPNSADFFLANPTGSARGCTSGYEPAGRLHNFQLWRRRP